MDNISNRTLALLLVTSIVISLTATVWTINSITTKSPTGKVATGYGNVSLAVLNQVSIILNDNLINFGTGSVNTSCTDILSSGKGYANLTASTTFTDSTDCWTGTPSDSTPYEIENNGNLNASVTVSGPTNTSFFAGYIGSNPMALMAKSRDSTGESGSCAGTLMTTWTPLSANGTVCSKLKWDPESSDEITVDLQVLIPKDLGTGAYSTASIEFYAVAG